MNFEEYAAKSLVLTPAGIPVPRGTLCISAAEAAMAAANIGPCVVKAQVPAGKRGKAGGIKLAAGPDEAKQAAGQVVALSHPLVRANASTAQSPESRPTSCAHPSAGWRVMGR